MEKILIIEDEESILMALTDDLTLEGYEVTCAQDGLQGLKMAEEDGHDLIILDIMLPKMDGFEVCRQLRQSGHTTPILILTAKSLEIDKVLGLEMGADDYVTKPFSPRELLARVRAILRRYNTASKPLRTYRFGDVVVDFMKHEVEKKGQLVHLTSLEFALMGFLIEHEGQVLDRSTILNGVWGEDVFIYPKTVDTHVGHLRKKIEDDSSNPKHIIGVRGTGYMFSA